MKFKFLSHTADMKFRAFGNTREKCFENSAFALKEIITKDKIKPLIKRKIKARGKDNESLLYNFLEEFLFLMDSENLILSKVSKIKIDKKKFELTAVCYFDNIKNYKTMTDVKAITYNEMRVTSQSNNGGNRFVCQVVVDV